MPRTQSTAGCHRCRHVRHDGWCQSSNPDTLSGQCRCEHECTQSSFRVEIPARKPSGDVDSAAPRSCRCEACKLARFERSKIHGAIIHHYGYKPNNGWQCRRVPLDPDNYFLGVELETDNYLTLPDGRRVESEISCQQAADMRAPKRLWIATSDSSVTGPEFASHPATLAYWRKHRPQVGAMLRTLQHAGFRSHDNDTCGMHVNISRAAFRDSAHLYRFLSLIHHSPAWSLKMSQRTADSARHWASLDVMREAAVRRGECERIAPRARYAHEPYPGTHQRYLAVNAPDGEARYEFRLPRGTLRVERFYKNLEWSHAMVEYTRTASLADSIPARFMAFAVTHRRAYPSLARFLRERFPTTTRRNGMPRRRTIKRSR